jgi:hypothetical protein
LLVRWLAAGVFLLAGWVIAANTVIEPFLHFLRTFAPVAKGEFADFPAGRAILVMPGKRAAIPAAIPQSSKPALTQLAAAEPVILPAIVAPPVAVAEPAAPELAESAAAEPTPAEDDAASILTEPVLVATAAPTIGGAEITLSSSVVAKAIEPTAADRADDAVPLPRRRPHTAAIPLPRPRPQFAQERPVVSGRIITDAEIAKHATY